ncbi:MAG TPA: endonuclease [Paludibacter sp.]|nr:endonuclease [Paludibacter sp.]
MIYYKRIFLSIAFLIFILNLFAQIPAGYYDVAVGKKDAALKTALHTIIKNHTQLEYYTSATYFRTTDWNPGGYFWDMYSNNKRTSWTSAMNREHNLPKSWWSTSPETTVAYSDLHNLYPSDATANSAKSNYPLGEVSGTPVFTNGVVKVGTNNFPGYNGTVFEPDDEFKGDFARDYMYVVTCYENYASNWRSTGTLSMLYNNTYPVFKSYAVNLLLKWHRTDPVSEKELIRNNAVFAYQNNRNPFVDFPILAEYLWGDLKGSDWTGSDPGLELPFYVTYTPQNSSLFVNVSQSKQASYSIYSIGGVLLQSGITNESQLVNVNTLDKGMYLIVVYTDTTRQVSKFLIW